LSDLNSGSPNSSSTIFFHLSS